MVASPTFVDISSLIDQRPGYREGRPFIAGTGVTIDRIAVLTTVDGLDADQIAYEMSLSAEQVHAALAFYYANRSAIEASLDEQDRLFDEAAKAHEARLGAAGREAGLTLSKRRWRCIAAVLPSPPVPSPDSYRRGRGGTLVTLPPATRARPA